MGWFDQFGESLERQTTNPLFLGGAALLTGEGMTGAMRGMQMGNQMTQQRRQQAEQEAQKARWNEYASGNMGGLTPEMQALVRASGPQGMKFASEALMRAPELDIQRQRLKIEQQNAARQGALTAAQLQQIKMQSPEWRMANAARFGIDPNTQEGRAFVITGSYAPKQTTFDLGEGHTRYQLVTQPNGTVRAVPIATSAPKIDSTARKAIYEAQDELPNIQSSIETLNEAKALLTGVGAGGAKVPQIYTGWGAQNRSNINQGLPSALPNIFTDPDRAKSTQRYNQIMTSEAIAAMAQSLKGATTNEEMARFISIMNDPSAGPEVKARTIDQMLRSAQRHMQNKIDRIKELGGRMPDLGGGGDQPVRVNSPEEARQLPKGTPILLPDGTVGRVP